jgi:hypothetical protein
LEQDRWITWANRLNAFRVIPRIVLFSYYTFFMYAWIFIVRWFIAVDWNALPKDPIVGAAAAAAIAGFPAIILGILSKILAQLTMSYWNGSSSKGAGH